LLGTDHIENTFSPILFHVWKLFTEPLSGDALVKSVTINYIYTIH
jgi:hypothetical protein